MSGALQNQLEIIVSYHIAPYILACFPARSIGSLETSLVIFFLLGFNLIYPRAWYSVGASQSHAHNAAYGEI